MSLNKVLMIGFVGKDPEVRYFDNNQCVANFSLALKRPAFRSKEGHIVPEQTDWIKVSTRGEVALYTEKYVKKGSRILVEGRLSTRTYTDKQGVQQYITEVIAERINFVDYKSTSSNESGN